MQRVLRFWGGVALLAAVVGCGAARVVGPVRPGPAGLEREVAARVDAQRRATGRPGLEYSAVVAEVARAHSRRMASGAVGFGHDGLRRRGSELAAQLPLVAMGENVSRHQRRSGFAEAALAGWLRSAPHRRNIEGDFQLTGVGTATSRDGVVYVTQIFVRTRR